MSLISFIRANAPFLAAGALLSLCSSFGQTFLISAFAGVIREEYSLSHGDWGAIYSIGTFASAVVMVWSGVLTDHFRVRALGAVVLVMLAMACLAMAFAPGAWSLPFVVFALRFAGQGMTSHIAVVAMARWFVASRGRALSIASIGIAAGEAFLPFTVVALLDDVPWRGLWIGFAVYLVLMVPVLTRLLRLERTPQSVAADSHAVGMNGWHWTRRQALRHWLFWLMVPAILAPSAWSTAFFFQQVHLAETKGWAHVHLVALFPLYTAVSVVAMLVSGWVIDRVGTARLMPVFQLPMAAGFVVVGLSESLWIAACGMALMALAQGANSTVPNAFWAEFFGTRNIGGIKALATAVMVLGSAIGPGITGFLIDFGIDFEDQMIGIAVYFLFAATLVWIGVRRARILLPATL
ncbi:MAG: MFS transporter [Rhodobacter sp.]|nr:MFS transporter [Rhodobacter sp.]